MKKYNLNILLKNDNGGFKIEVEYDSEYQLQANVIKMGTSGVWRKINDKKSIYYPPTEIEKIEIDKV
jgi:hypothetical protein